MLKQSKYNYVLPYKNDFILFNGISKQVMEFPGMLKSIIEEYLESPNKIDPDVKLLSEKLIDGGFVVEASVDEIELIKQRREKVQNSKFYTLTILPTFQCNFSCWYCIQSHRDEYMTMETVDRIKKHIENYLLANSIKRFEIMWFGGEPLLCFNSHIVEICEFARTFCEKHGIVYTNVVTTNGYLVTREMAIKMRSFNFINFQITIDGERNIHDKTRNQNGKGSFDTILKNINILLESIPQATVILRFNYTTENLALDRIVNEVNGLIRPEYRNRIQAFPRKVWQIDKDDFQKFTIEGIDDKFRQSGYIIDDVDIPKDFTTCTADKVHNYVIYHDGAVDKCTNIDPKEASHRLMSDGKIVQVKNVIQKNNPFAEDGKCYYCKHLPICLGPCLTCIRNMQKAHEFICVEKYSNSRNIDNIYHYCEVVLHNKQ